MSSHSAESLKKLSTKSATEENRSLQLRVKSFSLEHTSSWSGLWWIKSKTFFKSSRKVLPCGFKLHHVWLFIYYRMSRFIQWYKWLQPYFNSIAVPTSYLGLYNTLLKCASYPKLLHMRSLSSFSFTFICKIIHFVTDRSGWTAYEFKSLMTGTFAFYLKRF